MAHRHCQDFERAGMPSPAGTGLSRRSFMIRGGALALAVYGGSRLLGLDALQAGVARAAVDGTGPVLVSVFLEGGIDSLSVLAPIGDPLYGRLRPKLALPGNGLTLLGADDRLGWHPAAAAIGQAANAARQASQLRQQLAPFAEDGAIVAPVPYPTSDDDFPKRLQGLAALLAAGLPIRCVALSAAGEYDTHDDQAGDLAKGLQVTADSLLAFQRDLEARGIADRVVIHVWSEFGRRGQENGSGGTDHGAAGVGFLLGTRVKGTMVGEFPGLQNGLDDDGNLKATSDFRGVYAAP